jgi:hypothetical protein
MIFSQSHLTTINNTTFTFNNNSTTINKSTFNTSEKGNYLETRFYRLTILQ